MKNAPARALARKNERRPRFLHMKKEGIYLLSRVFSIRPEDNRAALRRERERGRIFLSRLRYVDIGSAIISAIEQTRPGLFNIHYHQSYC